MKRAKTRTAESSTVLGVKRKHLATYIPPRENPKFNEKFQHAQQKNRLRTSQKQALEQQRRKSCPFSAERRRATLVSSKPVARSETKSHLERKSLRVVDIRVKNDTGLAAPRPGQKLEVWRATTQPPVIEIAKKRSMPLDCFGQGKPHAIHALLSPVKCLVFFSSHPVFRISCEPSHSH